MIPKKRKLAAQYAGKQFAKDERKPCHKNVVTRIGQAAAVGAQAWMEGEIFGASSETDFLTGDCQGLPLRICRQVGSVEGSAGASESLLSKTKKKPFSPGFRGWEGRQTPDKFGQYGRLSMGCGW